MPMNADSISMLLAATVANDRERAQQAEKELDAMRKVMGHGFFTLCFQVLVIWAYVIFFYGLFM